MRYFLFVFLAGAAGLHAADPVAWKPADSPLLTRWAKDVSPDRVLPEYPRPQMVRRRWTNLNGLWDYAVTPNDTASPPAAFEGKILVPFPIEAPLSGVKRALKPDERLWYRRTFDAPTLPEHGHLLLHFGAVDWQASVSVNGQTVGEHKGGYDPFTCDITDALKPGGGPQEIIVNVYDPTDTGDQPLGKQVLNPKSIRYTATSGIWQTVWLEAVPATYISGLKIVPDVDHHAMRLTVQVTGDGAEDVHVQAEVYGWPDEKTRCIPQTLADIASAPGAETVIKLDNPRLWSPDSPFLYGLTVWIQRYAGESLDEVDSYFAMRKIERTGDAAHPGYALNGKPVFLMGVPDQGFWPDGADTAPTDDALRYDIEVTKQLGFNTSHKYVDLLERVHTLRDHDGLAGAIYTQLTDVELECTGLISYDRAVIHPDVTRAAAANRSVQTGP